MGWLTLGLLVSLTLVGCGDTGTQATVVQEFSGRPEAEEALADVPAANDLDLSLVTADSFAAAVLFPQQMLSQPWAETPSVQTALTDWNRQLGLDLEQIERVLMVWSPPADSDQPVMVARVELLEPSEGQPFDLEQQLAELDLTVQRDEQGDRVYWRVADQPLAFYQAEDGSVWLGDPSRLKVVTSERVPPGALARRLRATPLSGDAMVIVDFRPVRSLMVDAVERSGSGLQPETGDADFTPRELVEGLEHLQLTLDTAASELLKLRLELGDAAMAEQLTSMFRKQISRSKVMIPLALSAMLKGVPDDVNLSLSALTLGALGGLRLEQDDKTLVAGMTLPDNSWDHVSVLMNYGAQLQARQQRQERLNRIAAALAAYQEEHDAFPVAGDSAGFDEQGRPYLSWRVHLLPYLDEEPLYREFDLNQPWDSPHNQALLERIPEVYAEASDEPTTSVLAFHGTGAAMEAGKGIAIEALADDPATTLLAIDAGPERRVPWTQPLDLETLTLEELGGVGDAQQPTVDVLTAAYEWVRLKRGITAEQWAGLLTASGNEMVPETVFVRPTATLPGGLPIPRPAENGGR